MGRTDSRIDTRLAQTGGIEAGDGAVAPPINLATTFARDADYQLMGEFLYARYGGPTVQLAENSIRDLEGGSDAMLFGAGLAATSAILETLESGDRLVAPTIMYHGAQDWMRRLSTRRGIDLRLFDAARPGALEEAVGDRATMVWSECPVNPTWDVIDIEHTADIAHRAGAVLVIDSTVAPPVTTRPIELGADYVMHSATKYLNGHSDVLGGVLVARQDSERWQDVKHVRKLTGSTMSAFPAWLLMRGMRTLGIRYDRSSATALEFATHFADHPKIERVLYPGLPTHPNHDVARKQMTRGFGGMLSMLIKGDEAATQAVARRLTTFVRATSLGGVESLVEHRATVEGPHSVVPRNLLRFSIGLEDPRDLIADLEEALG